MQTTKKFNIKLSNAMDDSGISDKVLSKKTKISYERIGRIHRGESQVSLGDAMKIAQVVNCNINDVVD